MARTATTPHQFREGAATRAAECPARVQTPTNGRRPGFRLHGHGRRAQVLPPSHLTPERPGRLHGKTFLKLCPSGVHEGFNDAGNPFPPLEDLD